MQLFSFFNFLTLVHVLIIIGVSIRVIQVRLPVATSLAWLILVFFLPLVGAIAYLVLGEKRLGQKSTTRSQVIKARYDRWLQNLPPEQLKAGGVEVAFILPVSSIGVFKVRPDLRLHRKIVVIDDTAACTGSFNLVDPRRLFKQDAGVGEWVDAMVRIEGPGVLALNALFRWDWEVETGCDLDAQGESGNPGADLQAGETDVQVIPSGPGTTGSSIYQLLLMSIYCAQDEIAMTTPYFVPDEAVSTALLTAAERGVKVTVIMSERNDSRLVH